jgi:hypothetical protein
MLSTEPTAGERLEVLVAWDSMGSALDGLLVPSPEAAASPSRHGPTRASSRHGAREVDSSRDASPRLAAEAPDVRLDRSPGLSTMRARVRKAFKSEETEQAHPADGVRCEKRGSGAVRR